MLTFDPSAFETITTQKALGSWIKRLNQAKSYCADTETTGLDTFTVDLVGMSLAVEEQGSVHSCYIPVGHHKEHGRQLDTNLVLDALKLTLKSGKPNLWHNAQYDMQVLGQKRYAVEFANVHDSMYMGYALFGDQLPSLGMDYLAQHFMEFKTIKFADVVLNRPGRADFRDVPHDEATHYAAEDTAVTLVLGKQFQAALKSKGLWEVYNRDRALIPVLVAMKLRGVKVDIEHLLRLEGPWTQEVVAIEQEAAHLVGRRVNLGSSRQVIEVLEGRGVEVPISSKTKAKSVDKFALELVPDEPFVELVKRHREKSKLLTAFVKGLPTKVREDTGRVHPGFSATRTKTARLSCSDPNLQQIPSRTADGKELRKAIVARTGFMLVGADLSQIELRVAAARSREPVLLEAYAKGEDVHIASASKILDIALKDVTSVERGMAKTANFLALYQGGAFQLARSLKIPLADAEVFLDDYWSAMRRLEEYCQECMQEGRRNGYVETMFGRRIFVPDIASKNIKLRQRAERLCVSGSIQGTAADVCRFAMVNAHASVSLEPKWQASLIVQCHDEIIIECLERYAEDVRITLKRDMETCCDIGVPIVSDAKKGMSWYDLK